VVTSLYISRCDPLLQWWQDRQNIIASVGRRHSRQCLAMLNGCRVQLRSTTSVTIVPARPAEGIALQSFCWHFSIIGTAIAIHIRETM
jgi:hypothetical protein